MLKHIFITFALVLTGAVPASAQFVSPEQVLNLDYFGQDGLQPYTYQPVSTGNYSPQSDPQIRAQEILESSSMRRAIRLGDTSFTSGPYIVQPNDCALFGTCDPLLPHVLGDPGYASGPVSVLPPDQLPARQPTPLVRTGVESLIGAIMLLAAFTWTWVIVSGDKKALVVK